MSVVSPLEQFQLFHGLPPEVMRKWGARFSVRRFAKRQNVAFPPDCPDAIYFVRSGRVKISYFSEDGKEFTVALLGPGEIYSEHSLATATALEDSEVLYTSMREFRSMLEEYPDLSLRLIRVLGQILRSTNDVILDLAFREVSARLARILLNASRKGEGAEGPCSLYLTHEEMASLAGTTRQTVNEILKRWERQGITSLHRGAITVLDSKELINKLRE